MTAIQIGWRDGPPPPAQTSTPAVRVLSVLLHALALLGVLQGAGVPQTIAEQFNEPPLVVQLAMPPHEAPVVVPPAPAPKVRRTTVEEQAAVTEAAPAARVDAVSAPAALPLPVTGALTAVGTLMIGDMPTPPATSSSTTREAAGASGTRTPAGVGGGDAPASAPIFDAAYLNNPRPPYPEAAVRRAVSGVVMLRVRVGIDGRAEVVELERSSGSRLLDESALNTVRTSWRFVPASRAGVPVVATVIVPVRFELQAH